jgi:flagellum-specific ATP synthase
LDIADKELDLFRIHRAYEHKSPYQRIGKIISSQGSTYEINLAQAIIGSTVEFVTEIGTRSFGEVVAIRDNRCLAMPYDEIPGMNSETRVYLHDLSNMLTVSEEMLGRVVDFMGNPIDNKGPIENIGEPMSIFGESINPLDRPPIRESLDTGIHAVNTFMTVGKGQRLAIMAGSGVGKSVTLGMMAQNTKADINVIALIGERGREVREFIERDLGEEGLKRSIVVVATSDQSPLIRTKAVYTANTIAEFFRNQGRDVLLMMDSVTRYAMAMREIGLGAGEPPGQKGYTPSVFSKLPQILERAGRTQNGGSITGLYTVLVEGDDMDEPIADAIRAIADGHIVLSRELASRNQFPAIDILQSISRVMNSVVSREHRIVASHLRDLLAAYRTNEDLINVGAYARGSNVKIDKAIAIYDDLMSLMKQEQDLSEFYSIEELYDRIVELARKAESVTVGEAS